MKPALAFCVLLAIGCFIGCTAEQASTINDVTITPEILTSYKSAFGLAEEPDQAVSVLDARAAATAATDDDHVHVGHAHDEHSHDAHAEHGHDHEDHAGHDDDQGHSHEAHDGHGHDADVDPDEHAGHDHDQEHSHDAHDGHGHDADVDHGHDPDEHAGHDHEHGDSHDAHGEHIVIVGKVGGAPGAERTSADFPFEKGQASFVIHDPSFESPHGEGHQHADGHDCHFCQTKAYDAQAIVQFLGDDGKPLPVDARELFDIKVDDIVVIKGHARMKTGLLMIHGEGLYIRR